MHIIKCRLILHDTLFYATREMGTLYETERYIHNYALSYALFGSRLIGVPYFSDSYTPRYAEDMEILNQLGIYVTPARPLKWDYLLITWKMAQVNYYRKPERFGKRGNYPENIGRAKELAPESEFEFVILSRDQVEVPRWIRLGKWMSKAIVETRQEQAGKERTGQFVCGYTVNPLDIAAETRMLAYDLISMPPVSLLDRVHMSGDYYQLQDDTCIPAGLAYRFPKG